MQVHPEMAMFEARCGVEAALERSCLLLGWKCGVLLGEGGEGKGKTPLGEVFLFEVSRLMPQHTALEPRASLQRFRAPQLLLPSSFWPIRFSPSVCQVPPKEGKAPCPHHETPWKAFSHRPANPPTLSWNNLMGTTRSVLAALLVSFLHFLTLLFSHLPELFKTLNWSRGEKKVCK